MSTSKLKPLELEELYQPGRHGRGTFMRRKFAQNRLRDPKDKELAQLITVLVVELLAGCQWRNSSEIYFAVRRQFQQLSREEFNVIIRHMAKTGEIEVKELTFPAWQSEMRLCEDCRLF